MATTQYKGNKPAQGKAAVASLMAVASAITLLGLGFGVYSLICHVGFSVMGARIPGVLFAAVVAFLGVRYFVSTIRLARKIKGMTFMWRNFRKAAGERQ
jgi:uncharacterized membrane protein